MNIVPIRDIVAFARGVQSVFAWECRREPRRPMQGDRSQEKSRSGFRRVRRMRRFHFPPFAAKAARLSGLFVFDGAMAWPSSAVSLGGSSDHGGIALFMLPRPQLEREYDQRNAKGQCVGAQPPGEHNG